MDKVEHPIHAHEKSDVNTTAIIKFGVTLTVAIVVICLLSWGLFAVFYLASAERETLPPPLYRSDRLPPEPRLQGIPGHQNFPSEDIREFRKRETTELNSYGWVNQQEGIVHIPIEEAKKIIVARGLTAHANSRQVRIPEKK